MAVGLVVIALATGAFASPPVAVGEVDRMEPGALPRESLPIVGGHPVEDRARWPDAAAIQYFHHDGAVQCTGTLIAPDVVITAGHCVRPDMAGGKPTEVILGAIDYDHPGELIGVDEVIEYPNSQTSGYDVGILILDEPSSYEPRIIGTECIEDYIDDGVEVDIVGYGSTDPQGQHYDSILREGVSDITDAHCRDSLHGCNPNLMPDGEVAAGEDGVTACHGDSGGPLYLPTPKGTYLIGVTSRSAGTLDCETGIFVRPDDPRLFAWIQDVTGRELALPACLEPTAPPLYAVKNHPGYSQIDPGTTDASVSYEITAQPTFGGAQVNGDGVVRFQPENGFTGEDAVTVRITASDGENGVITIPVKMVGRSAYHDATGLHAGCATVPSSSLLLGLAGLLITRRRTTSARK
jgi:hypothetical protein